FKNAAYLGEIVRNAPLDRLLIETDSPYLAPHPMRGRRNEPAYVVYVAEHVGKWRGLSGAEIGEITFANARNLFGVRADGC
ncbi:MAG: TatD family hydrolase, partial [Chloroflexi bacterium]|nr:TatD family hydrolase [Chloroflexota bacterium]